VAGLFCCAGTTQELSIRRPRDLGLKPTGDHSQCTLGTVVNKMRRFSSFACSLNTIAKRYSSDMAQNYVKRITLFKVPKSEHIEEARQTEDRSLVCPI
jgi:hypothetical protein